MGDDRKRSRIRRGGRRTEMNFRDDDRDWDDGDDRDDEDEPRRKSRRDRSRSRPPRRRGGMDWDAADDYDDDEREYESRGRRHEDDDDYDDDERDRPRRRVRRRERKKRRKRKSLMQLCTHVFGYAAVLPREEGDPQPEYLHFRQQVVAALQNLERDAQDERIEREDVQEASYALALFIDEQVVGSSWEAKEQWAAEPLHIVLHQDAEGGVNFFRRLESLGDRQTEVKEVFLVCLALGFRGKYAAEELRRQATRIDEIKQGVLKSIRTTPLDKEELLFPDAYRVADPIEDEVEPPPRWWMIASLGTVALVILLWAVMFFLAGGSPSDAKQTVEPLVRAGQVEAPPAAPVEPEPVPDDAAEPEEVTP